MEIEQLGMNLEKAVTRNPIAELLAEVFSVVVVVFSFLTQN